MPTPCVVSGNLQTLTSGQIAQGRVIFQLTNIGTGNPINVIGTAIFPALVLSVETDSTGAFSTQLWGNDNINPANTLYLVTYRDSLGNQVGPIQYLITGATFNLNTAAATGSVSPPILAQLGSIKRLFLNTGTALAAGNFALSAGWGNTAAVSGVLGFDPCWEILITANGTGISSSPTIVLTFADGTWTNSPIAISKMVGGTGQFADVSDALTATTWTMTYNGLPVAGSTYRLRGLVIGR
jgi:hypothetical protein